MRTQRIGIIMHGITGRMGMNQHLIRSVLAIRDQGGVQLADGSFLVPDPILVGRNADKVEAIAKAHNVRALDDRSRRGARQSAKTRCSSTPLRPSCARQLAEKGHRRR
jgi:hypothetical protein